MKVLMYRSLVAYNGDLSAVKVTRLMPPSRAVSVCEAFIGEITHTHFKLKPRGLWFLVIERNELTNAGRVHL